MTSRCRKVLAVVILVAGGGTRMFAQGDDCYNGIVRMNDKTTGSVTVCRTIADQVPALARQISELNKVIVQQNSQLADMRRLIRSVNNVARPLDLAQQTQLVESIVARLQVGKDVGSKHLESRVTTLADDFEDTEDQIQPLLSNPATAAKATAALHGPTGDAIARLDFSTVHSQLEDISAQLRQLNSKVDEVNTKTGNIEKIMEASRISATNVQNALMAADMQVLQLVVPSSNSAKVVEEAFRQRADGGKSTVARHFFSASAQSPQALQWFDAQLAAGLDPNMTVPGDSYPAEAILIEAMRAGNVRAMELLLQHGASPHPYQNLPYTPWVRARFVFPLSAIAADDRFSVADKQRLARAFLTAGAVVPAAEKAGAFSGEVFYVVQELQQKVAGELGMPLTPTPTLCQQPQTAICKTASTRDKRDWCGIVRTMPRMIQVVNWLEDAPARIVELRYLLNIYGGKLYFLGIDSNRVDYVLAEVSQDSSTWNVLVYTERASSLCHKVDPGDTGPPPSCWQGFTLHRVVGTDEMKSSIFGSWSLKKAACQR